MNVKNKILETIKKDKIEPTPKWIFSLKETFIWSSIILGLLIIGSAVGVISMFLIENDWDVYNEMDGVPFLKIISNIPLIWILSIIIFVILILLEVRKTKRGYKRSSLLYLSITIILGILLGGTFYGVGFSRYTDEIFNQTFPAYQNLNDYKQTIWSQPNEGLISGEIMTVDEDDQNITVKDFSGKIWNVDVWNINKPEIIKIGGKIKILGKNYDEVFMAEEIRPWR